MATIKGRDRFENEMTACPGAMLGRAPLGKIVATPGALEVLTDAGKDPLHYITRHRSGDWGDLDNHDRREIERSLEHGWRILSSYMVRGKTIWIITEAGRSVTTILLPEEY
jgi:hypothetical protein